MLEEELKNKITIPKKEGEAEFVKLVAENAKAKMKELIKREELKYERTGAVIELGSSGDQNALSLKLSTTNLQERAAFPPWSNTWTAFPNAKTAIPRQVLGSERLRNHDRSCLEKIWALKTGRKALPGSGNRGRGCSAGFCRGENFAGIGN